MVRIVSRGPGYHIENCSGNGGKIVRVVLLEGHILVDVLAPIKASSIRVTNKVPVNILDLPMSSLLPYLDVPLEQLNKKFMEGKK